MQQATHTTTTRQQDAGLDLGYLFGALWDHKGLIVGLTLFSGLIGAGIALKTPPVYKASALVQVESKKSGMGDVNLPGLFGEPAPTSNADIEILRSRMILGQVAEQMKLTTVIEPTQLPLLGDTLTRYGIQRPDFARDWPNVWAGDILNVAELKVAQEWIGVPLTLRSLGDGHYALYAPEGEYLGSGQAGETFSRPGNWIELRVSRLQAASGAEFTLTKRSDLAATRDLQGRFDVNQRGKETGVLDLSLIGGDREELTGSLDAISQVYLTQNIERQAAEAEKSLAFLDKQVPNVRETLSEAENRLNRYRATQNSVDLTFETQNALNSLVQVESQINELKLAESELARRFTPSHPTYQALLEKKQQLQREQARLEEQANDLPETQKEVLRLTRDVNVTQEIYVQLLNRMQELRISKAGTVGNVRILDKAVIDGMIAPQRSLIVAVALFSGVLLALCIVMIKLIFNRGIEAAAQLEALGLPVYAMVPLSEKQTKLSTRRKRKSDKTHSYIIGDLLASRNPADLSVEALRGLRTSLHFAMLESSDNRLMITGSAPAVGKSFISVNLAAVCAQAGKKVLIIDGDLRKGYIHSAFGGHSERGLSELLANRLDLDDAIRHSRVEGLDYMSRGISPPNPSELLMQESFTHLLNLVSSLYDLVIIDTPPVLAVTEAAIVGKQVGTSLLVVRFGVNPPREVEAAMQSLENSGVTIKGAILNAIERKAASSYGYYGYYHYSYT